MRKIIVVLLVILLFTFVSCTDEPKTEPSRLEGGTNLSNDDENTTKEYKVGDRGPTGDFIFYDVDADNMII